MTKRKTTLYRLPLLLCILLLTSILSCTVDHTELVLTTVKRLEHAPSPNLFTAAPTVIVHTITDNFDPAALPRNPRETTVGEWQVDGANLLAVHHYSRAIDELPKTSSRTNPYPVNVQYWTYLVLDSALETGRTYTVTGPYGTDTLKFDDSKVFCESIKVNQVGYHPDTPVRYANLGVYLGSGGSMQFDEPIEFVVRTLETLETLENDADTDASDITKAGAVVYEGIAEYRGDDTLVDKDTVTSGEHVYRLDLSQVPPGGPYIIQVKGFGISYPFEISRAAVDTIAAVYARGLYHQRCGIALEEPYTRYTRPVCHTEVADTRKAWSSSGKITPAAGTPFFDIAGGYHDAGDFDRRPQHTIIPILMLNYYEAFPSHFTDGQYTIPESGNGLPDFLDEALWGVRSWENLQITDPADPDYGGIMAGTETNAHPEYGDVSAASDPLIYGTWDVSDEVTAFGAGMMAQAARLLLDFPGWEERAAVLWERALAAWNYLDTHSDGDGDGDGDGKADGDGDEDGERFTEAQTSHLLYASLQLYLTSRMLPASFPGESELERKSAEAGAEAGESESESESAGETFFAVFARLAEAMLVKEGSWPHQYRPGNTFAKLQTAHFISFLLAADSKLSVQADAVDQAATAQNADPEQKADAADQADALIDSPRARNIADAARARILREAAKGGYMGFDETEAFYPHGVTKGYGWGSATAQGRYADVYAFAYRITDDPQLKSTYFGMLSQFGDYALGLNPLGVSYVTGLGAVQPNSPLHLDSYFTKYGLADGDSDDHAGRPIGNVPGILIFGPTEGRSKQPYQLAVSDTVYPIWEELPLQRRWADGWSLINSNEFSTWETMIWNTCLYGVLSGITMEP